MPTIDSSTIIKGPAIAAFNGATHYTAGDITIATTTELATITSSAFGDVDSVVKIRTAAAKFQPLALSAALAAKLFPYAASIPGTMLCGATDVPLIIQTLAGAKHTYQRACVAGLPKLTFAIDQLLVGEASFNATCATDADLSDADSLVKVEASAFADASFNPAHILRGPWSVAWGEDFDDIKTEGGVTVDFSLQVEAEYVDGLGVVDWSLKGLTATATFTPVGLSASGWLAMQQVQGAGHGVGARGSARGNDLVVTGSGLTFTLTSCAPSQGDTNFGAKRLPGQITMQAHRKFTAGVMQPLFTFAFSA